MHNHRLINCTDSWDDDAVWVLNALIRRSIQSSGICNLMLTGGKSAAKIYRNSKLFDGISAQKLKIFIGDERCVDSSHTNSNYALVERELQASGRLEHYSVEKIIGDGADYDLMAEEYSSLLPHSIDILLLSLGLDGHIASIFPGDRSIHTETKLLTLSQSHHHPHKRITISPLVIQRAGCTVLLAVGSEKGQILLDALQKTSNPIDYPVQLLLNKNSIWLLDQAAANKLKTLERVNIETIEKYYGHF